MKRGRTGWIPALTVAALLAAAPVAAQPRQRAEALLQEGNVLHDQKRYAKALERYRQARALYPSYKIEFNMALTLEAMGSHVEAAELLESFLAQADDPATVKVARERLAALRGRLGRVAVSCPRGGAMVSVDSVVRGKTPLRAPLYVRPGAHGVAVAARGHARFTRQLVLAAGELVALRAVLIPLGPEPVESPPAPTVREPFYKTWWFWTAVGVVVVGGTVGVALASTSRGDAGVGPGELPDVVVSPLSLEEM